MRLHRTGHGFGLGNHEAPWVAEGSPDILAENMVISIEPGIYMKGIGGLRHSDTVLVTKDGCELLTHLPTDIESLTIKGRKLFTRLKGWWVRRALRLSRKGYLSLGAFGSGRSPFIGLAGFRLSGFTSPVPQRPEVMNPGGILQN